MNQPRYRFPNSSLEGISPLSFPEFACKNFQNQNVIKPAQNRQISLHNIQHIYLLTQMAPYFGRFNKLFSKIKLYDSH